MATFTYKEAKYIRERLKLCMNVLKHNHSEIKRAERHSIHCSPELVAQRTLIESRMSLIAKFDHSRKSNDADIDVLTDTIWIIKKANFWLNNDYYESIKRGLAAREHV